MWAQLRGRGSEIFPWMVHVFRSHGLQVITVRHEQVSVSHTAANDPKWVKIQATNDRTIQVALLNEVTCPLLHSNGRLSSKCLIRTNPSSISRDGYLVQQRPAHCNPLLGPAQTINYAIINSKCFEEALNDSTVLATAARGNRKSCIDFSRVKTQGGIKSPFHKKKKKTRHSERYWRSNLLNTKPSLMRCGPEIGSGCWRDFPNPSWPWDTPRLLYKARRFSFLWVKRQGCGVNHPHPSIVKVKKEYRYTSTPLLGLHCLFWSEHFAFWDAVSLLWGRTVDWRKIIFGTPIGISLTNNPITNLRSFANAVANRDRANEYKG